MHLNEQNRQLWERVAAFNIAEYAFNYGFALRLATENKWSFSFTDAAILEYKKFMFLAAISEEMMAPAKIVDTVWHLHLIYSDAYQSFCAVLGKEIRHIPSRKQVEEQEKFQAAKILTQNLYEPVFGPMPEAIWKYESMYDSLHLSRASCSPERLNILALALLPGLIAGLYFLLLPVYRSIDSLYFLPAYLILGAIIFLILRRYNQQQFKRLINRIAPSSFLFQLRSPELITLKSGDAKASIHALTNELILKKHIAVDNLNLLSVIKAPSPDQIAPLKVYEVFDQAAYPVIYDKVLYRAIYIPYFQAIQSFSKQLQHYIYTSKEYLCIALLNYSLIGIFLTFGLVRIFAGLSTGKPISYILFLVFIFTVLTVHLLKHLKFQFLNKVLPDHYFKSPVLRGQGNELQWAYLQSGQLAFTAAFIPVIAASIAADDHNAASGSSCTTFCGSSCGGCGGD